MPNVAKFQPATAAPHRLAILAAALLFAGSSITACAVENGATTTKTPAAASNSTADIDATTKKGIYNYIEYSDRFASSGQPTAEQLKAQKAAGVERVIYIAFSDQEHSLPAEDRIAKALGLNYLQLPVDWTAPQKRDYYLFAQAMLLEPERKTLLHCQANFRATAFSLLYRVLENGVPLGEAKADMNSIWVPNRVWTNFILDILQENNVDTACSACDWTPSTIGD